MFFGLVIAFAVAAALVAAAVGAVQRSNQAAAWQRAAETLGVAVDGGTMIRSPRIHGTVDGLACEVAAIRESSGDNSHTYTRYRVSYPSLGLGLRLARESGLTRLVRVFGAQDHQVGDDAFDSAFEVKGNDAAAVGAFLDAGRRQMLLRLLASHPEVVVGDAEIVLKRRGVDRDADVVVSTMRRLTSAAAALTDDHLTDRIRRTIERRRAGDLAASVPITRVHPHPDDVEEALLEAEGLVGSGRTAEAESAVSALSDRLPADPDVAGLRRALETPSSPPAHTEPSDDAVAVAADLFSENRLSFETSQRFADRYAGIPVRWRGRVRRATPLDHDRDFGGGPMVKAVIHVATIANDLYGQAEVDAVVAFPEGTALSEGTEVSFTGTLVNVDGLIRNLFVANGAMSPGLTAQGSML